MSNIARAPPSSFAAYERRHSVIDWFLSELGVAYLRAHPVAVLESSQIQLWYPDFTITTGAAIIDCARPDGTSPYVRNVEYTKAIYRGAGYAYCRYAEEDSSDFAAWADRVTTKLERSLNETAQRLCANRKHLPSAHSDG